jgi:hypothetical protein
MAPRSAHDAIYITLSPRAFDEAALKLLMELARAFRAELGYVHLRTSTDSADVEHYQRHIMPFSQGLTTHHLRDGLPDLPWGTIFGPSYESLFGRQRLLTTPAALIVPNDTSVYVQLTNDITDVITRREDYEAARAAAKEHLDSNAFRGNGTAPRVPAFF